MGLDILYTSIIKNINSIGGFCIIPPSKIDYIKYFPIDSTKIGVSLPTTSIVNPWTRMNDDPRNKEGAAWCSNGDIIYMYGGCNSIGAPDKDLWSFNTINQVWTKISDSNLIVGWNGSAWVDGYITNSTIGTRCGASMVYYNNKLYIYGGYPLIKGSGLPGADIPCNILHVYDLTTNTWSSLLQNTAAYPSVDHGIVVSQTGVIYVYGGDRSSGVQRLNQHFKYNISTNIWEELKGLTNTVDRLNTIGRQGCIYEYKNGYIYLYGGIKDGMSTNNSMLSDMYKFDTTTELWTKLSDGPGKRSGAEACFRSDGYMYMIGGSYILDGVDIRYTDFWRYDIESDTWNSYYYSPTQRTSFTLEANTNNEIWLVGEDAEVYMFQDSTITSDYVAAIKLARG